MMSRKQGSQYENIAANHLTEQGLSLIERNYHAYRGEIDLVMLEQQTLVFIEVKFRKNTCYGHPAEFVTYQKQKHLAQAAQKYLLHHPVYKDHACRFDVVAIQGSKNSNDFRIDWIKNAFLIT